MKSIIYKCLKCGICCFEISESPRSKRIPLYPEEVARLEEIAKQKEITFYVIEDVVFPDIINNTIIVLTYKILLTPLGHCPFYDSEQGCIIHGDKPLACQSYPLSLKQIDAFNLEITIDPLCKWIQQNYSVLNDMKLENLKKVFKEEYPKAEKFFRKNKKLQLKIVQLEAEKRIKIPRKLKTEDYNIFLKEWDRKELIV